MNWLLGPGRGIESSVHIWNKSKKIIRPSEIMKKFRKTKRFCLSYQVPPVQRMTAAENCEWVAMMTGAGVQTSE